MGSLCWGRSFRWFRGPARAAFARIISIARDFFGTQQVHRQESTAVKSVGPEFDALVYPIHRVLIIAAKRTGQQNQAGYRPRHIDVSHRCPRGNLEIAAMVHQPVQIEEALVDNVFVAPSLYSIMTGDPSWSIPSVSMRPRCFWPVLNSVATKRTPKSGSRFASMSLCSPFSLAGWAARGSTWLTTPALSWNNAMPARCHGRSVNVSGVAAHAADRDASLGADSQYSGKVDGVR